MMMNVKKWILSIALSLVALAAYGQYQAHLRGAFVGGGGATPAFVASQGVFQATNTSGGTDAVTLTGAISSGSMAIVLISSDYDVTSITDTGGNTYTEQKEVDNAIRDLRIWSAPITTALSVSDTVTLTYASTWYAGRQIEVVEVSDATVADVSASLDQFATTHAPTGTTTAATTIVGVTTGNSSATVSTGSNSTLLSRTVEQSRMARGFYLDSGVVGSQSVGVVMTASASIATAWVAVR